MSEKKKGKRQIILETSEERVKIVIKLIKNGVQSNYEIKEKLKKYDWYDKVRYETILNYIKKAKRIVKSSVSDDYLLNTSFIFNELQELYVKSLQINDLQASLKILQEMSKVQGLHDIDLKKMLLYKEELLRHELFEIDRKNKIDKKKEEQDKIEHIASKEDIRKRILNEDF